MDLRLTAYCALGFAAVFGLVSLLTDFGDWNRLGLVTAFGLFVGVCAAPEITPKRFRLGWLLQISAGFIAGLLVALYFQIAANLIVYCAIIGGFVGGLAPGWCKHIHIP